MGSNIHDLAICKCDSCLPLLRFSDHNPADTSCTCKQCNTARALEAAQYLHTKEERYFDEEAIREALDLEFENMRAEIDEDDELLTIEAWSHQLDEYRIIKGPTALNHLARTVVYATFDYMMVTSTMLACRTSGCGHCDFYRCMRDLDVCMCEHCPFKDLKEN